MDMGVDPIGSDGDRKVISQRRSGGMAFCFRGMLGKLSWPCGSKGGQDIIRTAYLKTYETVVSDEDGGSDEGYRDTRRESKIKKSKSKGDVKKSKGSPKRSRDKKQREDVSWMDEYRDMECESSETSPKKRSSVKRRHRGKDRKDDGGGRKTSRTSSTGNEKTDRRHTGVSPLDGKCESDTSKTSSLSRNKRTKSGCSKILERYKSRTYERTGEHRKTSGEDTDMEMSEDSGAMRREILSGNKHTREMRMFRGDPVDDSESEINFVVDLYDRASLNNSLREKMLEYLKQMGEK